MLDRTFPSNSDIVDRGGYRHKGVAGKGDTPSPVPTPKARYPIEIRARSVSTEYAQFQCNLPGVRQPKITPTPITTNTAHERSAAPEMRTAASPPHGRAGAGAGSKHTFFTYLD